LAGGDTIDASPRAAGWARLRALLGQPANGASLAVFRIAVGIIMSLEAIALWQPNPAAISTGLSPLETYYSGPDIRFHFPYSGFEWLPLLPSPWMHAMVALLAVAGLVMALGLFYRVAATTIFVT
jgi:hypothetical protein